MHFLIAPDAGIDIHRLTDSRFVVDHDTSGVYLVDLGTGRKARIMEPIPHEFDFAKVESLSRRERQAFELLGEGRTMREIASRMSVSAKTAETYRARIKEKFDVTNGVNVLRLATEWNLLNRTRVVAAPQSVLG